MRRPDRVVVGYSVEGGGLLEARARSTCCSRLGISSVVSVLFVMGFLKAKTTERHEIMRAMVTPYLPCTP